MMSKRINAKPHRSEEDEIYETLHLFDREEQNNMFISATQQKELRLLDERLRSVSANQQFELVTTIQDIQEQIKKERLDVKFIRSYNFLEGRYLDKATNGSSLPKIVEIQQEK